MTLKERISEDMKAAMRAKDAARLSAVRLLLAAMKQKEVDERVELTDADVLGVIERMVKQRRESIAQYEKAARADLAAQEQFEIGVLQAYLPQQLGEAELAQAVAAALAEAGAASVRDMGKVMALLKPRLAGRADMGKVSALVKAKLGA
ncbi:MAG: GatB/YqeY domain-containing protein [Betaproteobacteria bacterium]|nr:GatB/YqeY domain-containing protein [Betaproteobacteria bacterium]MDH5220760.1 GatB/YqeY domain-containing protein [Betaproteobacteria bacterium]MDH5352174.1 GatB/YqeY domain-containing protein [Betaproteobacteria bacterium]